MADLRPAGERGQLLIVASVAFAVILIALALALNTAVYSNVHVSQTDSGSFEERSALEYEKGAERGIAALLPLTGADESQVEDRLDEEAELWEALTRSEYARDGVGTTISVEPAVIQDRIVHDNETRAFENENGTANWTVVRDVTDDVVYQMTIGNESLASGENDSEFTLEVTGATDNDWTLSAFSTEESEIVVAVDNGTAETRQYETNQSSLQVDLANGIFNETGDREQFISFVEDDEIDPGYDISYRNATNVTGTYYLFEGTLDIEELEVDDDDYGEGAEESPRIDEQVASAEVTVNYRSTELHYENTIDVRGGVYDDDD